MELVEGEEIRWTEENARIVIHQLCNEFPRCLRHNEYGIEPLKKKTTNVGTCCPKIEIGNG